MKRLTSLACIAVALTCATVRAQSVEFGRMPNADLVSWPLFTAPCAQDYQVYWDGSGIVDVLGATSYMVPSRRKGTIVAAKDAVVAVRVTASDKVDPIRNVSVWAPACAAPPPPAGYVVVKNWDFGTSGNVRNTADLEAQFQFHDQFHTIANGERYGSYTAATSAATAIAAPTCGTCAPSFMQPIDSRVREFTATSLLMHVVPRVATQTTVGPAWKKDALDGSMAAKYTLPKGGSRLGKDMKWETRCRMASPLPQLGNWTALWVAGDTWHNGPEADLLEGFSSEVQYGHHSGQSWHSNWVPATNDAVSYNEWWAGMATSGLSPAETVLTKWHVWELEYLKDDTYTMRLDGHVIQHGSAPWRDFDATRDPNMSFLFDMRAGITDVWPISSTVIDVPSSGKVFTLEVDYSRVSLRD
jgi:hypothetical protein